MSGPGGEVQYATSVDGTRIAYELVGDGGVDLLFVPPAASHLEMRWDDPAYASFLRRLASFSRLITLDKRGSGLSDRAVEFPTTEQQVDDIVSVLDAAGSERAFLFGVLDGAISSMLVAAAHPHRVVGVMAYAGFARMTRTADYPVGLDPDDISDLIEIVDRFDPAAAIPLLAPSMVGNAAFERFLPRFVRSSTSPSAMGAWARSLVATDIRDVLPSVRVPVQVMCRVGDPMIPPGVGEWLTEHLPDASFVELPGSDYFFWVGERDAVLDAIEVFVTGKHSPVAVDRVLATVLFTDIAGSTERAAALGDDRWRRVLDDHDATAKTEIDRHSGRLIKLTGDGMLATFDGPGRAIACARSIMDSLTTIEITLRVGIHTGEVEVRDGDVGGIAVHIASRIQNMAEPNEILVSRTVVDLAAGSGLKFAEHGTHELRGVPGNWQLFTVVA